MWRTGVPPTGSVRYGKQYDYRCPSCRGVVVPRMTPSLAAMDLTNLGTRIGDRAKPLAPATMARAERCRQRFADFPAILMPAKAVHGSERHPWQPLATQTSQQETAILSTGALIAAAGNTYERPGSTCRSRDLSQPVKGHEELPSGGHENCPLVATRSARWWPRDLPGVWLGQGVHPLAGHGLGETHAVSACLADVGVVQEPVDGGGGQCLGHEFVESNWSWHMFVMTDFPC